jgi:CrcB protein
VSAALVLALGVAGGAGSVVRFMFDGVIRTRVRTASPIGTMTVNISGSLALGLLTGLVLAALLPTEWALVLGTGFLGGYTTFSTASVETVRLLQAGRTRAALLTAGGTALAALAAAGAGLSVALLFT